MRAIVCVVVVLAVFGAGCAGEGDDPLRARDAGTARHTFPPPPSTQQRPLARDVSRALDELLAPARVGVLDRERLARVAASRDPRLAWLVSDLLRFYQGANVEERALVDAFTRLTGVDPRADPLFAKGSWRLVTDYLVAWDTPAPPRYRERKGVLYLGLEPGWEPFLADEVSEIDWRRVAWGGVLIDDRPLGATEPCLRGCIPALDDPLLVPAADGTWYPDDRTVFGVVVDGEAVALPKNVMQVHEMVNITVGGRRLGIPYCTLCGSAQAYLTDAVPARFSPLVLRTSGLLQRSNKLMYDLHTRSAIDTFTGRALSGPLRDARVALEQITVVTSNWGEWKAAHPDTKIVAPDGGIGRNYPDDPLRGRDDDGPIFPIGDVDPRLPVQAEVVGVIAPDGTPVAFPAAEAGEALRTGKTVELAGVELVAEGGGFRARLADGDELPAHQAFWFAWSQFHPGTRLWPER
ncbi:MAG TPA: DUF3179 domain-containing (seleno)protein [Gaiellaceae bacterium]|nr:DUF3179 domain-containing (seleno)protein [Gaiellaceae bacterium]